MADLSDADTVKAQEAKQRDRVTSVAAAYQVTARILVGEQQSIWTRTQSFFVVNVFVAGFLLRAELMHRRAYIAIAIVGAIVTIATWSSLSRSWAYRDLWLKLLRSQEKCLALTQEPRNPEEPLASFSEGQKLFQATDWWPISASDYSALISFLWLLFYLFAARYWYCELDAYGDLILRPTTLR